MSAHPLTFPRRVDDLFLYRLNRLVSVAGAPVIRLCEGVHGITRREWRLIAMLAMEGPRLSSDLADRVRLDRGRTSRVVSVLAEKGLVTRHPKPNDGRLVEVALTPAGQAIYERLFPEVARINRELLEFLGPEELDQLDDLLTRLQSRAEAWLAQADLPKADRRRGRQARPGGSAKP